MQRWHFIYVILGLLPPAGAASQTAAHSVVADTSYTLHSAYKSAVKTNPETRWVADTRATGVRVQKNIPYQKQGSRTLVTDVFMPIGKSKRIAIILVHGGGWRSGNKGLHHPMAQELALRGYTCFTPEYRLSGEALFPAAVHDLKAVLRWVRSRAAEYHVDTNRIAVAGHSAGGQLAAFLGATNGTTAFEGAAAPTRFSSNVNAVVDMDGILAFIHPESGEGDDSKGLSAATRWLGSSKTEDPALWQQASPLTHAGPHMPPVLFINSSVSRMHAGRDDLTRLMDPYGIYHEVRTFADAPHSFPLFEPWFTPTVDYIDRFIQKIFKDDVEEKT